MELFCYYFAKLFNYFIDNDSKTENRQNMNENEFLLDRNKLQHAIGHKGYKNLYLVQYNLPEFVNVIESIRDDKTKLRIIGIF